MQLYEKRIYPAELVQEVEEKFQLMLDGQVGQVHLLVPAGTLPVPHTLPYL